MGSQKQFFMKNIGTIVSELSMPKKKKKLYSLAQNLLIGLLLILCNNF